MGVREIAAAAVEAKEAKEALERKEYQKRHGDAAVALVEQHLHLTGKYVRARETSAWAADGGTDNWGDSAVVRVEDDGAPLYIRVHVTPKYGNTYLGHERVGTEIEFDLANADGVSSFPHPTAEQPSAYRRSLGDALTWEPVRFTSPKFRDLPGLAEALRKYDLFLAATDLNVISHNFSAYSPGNLRIRPTE